MIRTIEVARVSRLAIISATAGLGVQLVAVPPALPPVAGLTVAPAAIPSTSSIGPIAVRTIVGIGPALISAASRINAPALVPGDVTTAPVSIASASRVPAPAVTSTSAAIVAPAIIGAASAVFNPVIARGAVAIAPTAIINQAAVAEPAISTGAVSVTPLLIASSASPVAPMISTGTVNVVSSPIASASVLYGPSVSAQAAGYDSDAAALFSAMTVQPEATRKARINDLIVGLKADGVWTKLDWLVLLAASTSQQALLNWRFPSKSVQTVNSPTFTTDRGYSGDGATSHLSFGEAFNANGNLYALNTAVLGVWCNLQGPKSGSRPLIGSTQSTRSYIGPANTGAGGARINDSTTLNIGAAETMLGSRVFSRTAANARAYYRDGAVSQSDTVAATAIATGPAFILRNGSDYADDRVPAAFSGSGLSATEVQAIHSRINTYLTAVGAN